MPTDYLPAPEPFLHKQSHSFTVNLSPLTYSGGQLCQRRMLGDPTELPCFCAHPFPLARLSALLGVTCSVDCHSCRIQPTRSPISSGPSWVLYWLHPVCDRLQPDPLRGVCKLAAHRSSPSNFALHSPFKASLPWLQGCLDAPSSGFSSSAPWSS